MEKQVQSKYSSIGHSLITYIDKTLLTAPVPLPPPSVAAERPDLSNIDPDLLSYITKQEFGNLPVNDKTKGAIATVMKYR